MKPHLAMMIALVVAGAGCTPSLQKPAHRQHFPEDKPAPEYTKIWDATSKVMSKYFMLRVKDMEEGLLVAEPAVGANPLTKYRTRVEAHIVKAGDRLWDVSVRVMNEVETSQPSTWGPQPDDEWAVVTFDKILESKLVNEIRQEAYGRPPWNLDYKYMKMRVDTPQPAKHRDLPKKLPGEAAAGPNKSTSPANPLGFDADGSHLAFFKDKPDFGNRFTVLMARGDIAFRRNMLEEASKQYRTAAEQKPNEPAAHIALSHAQFAMGRYGEAALSLRKAFALDTGWLDVSLERRKLYADPEGFSRRLEALQQHTEAHPDDDDARFVLAYALKCGGDNPGSVAQLDAVLKRNPDDGAARRLLELM